MCIHFEVLPLFYFSSFNVCAVETQVRSVSQTDHSRDAAGCDSGEYSYTLDRITATVQ
jgi:hypothetical protein